MRRKTPFSGDQWLLVLDIGAITLLVIVGLLLLAFSPAVKSETVMALISLGVGALAALAGKPSFPVPSPTQEASPAGAVIPAVDAGGDKTPPGAPPAQ